MFALAESFPVGFRCAEVSQDAFQRMITIRVILDAARHGDLSIFHGIGSQQGENTSCFVPSIPTLFLQTIEVLLTKRSPVRILFSQQKQLLSVILGGKMSLLNLFLMTTTQQLMLGHEFDRTVVDEESVFRDAHGQRVTDQPPRRAIAIVGVADQAFAIDDPIDDLRCVETQRR